MTRSEKLEKAIALSKFNLEWLTKRAVESVFYNEQLEAEQLTLDLLLAEQKRSEGCEYCKTQTCGNCTGKFVCSLAGCSNDYAAKCTCFNAEKHCEVCGRDLTDGESV